MRFALIFVIMMALCVAVSATTITSDFKTSGEGTMTHYSYLKEPKVEESGFKSGYKMGSLSYLEDGIITLNDSIIYYDGQIDSEHGPGDNLNSSVYQKQDVNFSGSKGISEFYAKGFFPSNRAISAWKKIRYDNLSYNFSKSTGKAYDVISLSSISDEDACESDKRYVELGSTNARESNDPPSVCYDQDALKASVSETCDRCDGLRYDQNNLEYTGNKYYSLGESYNSSRIIVHAEVGMGPNNHKSANDYDFVYNAKVENGIIEIRDATGWTNKTGAIRVDWERDALMKGDFEVENNLKSKSLLFPGAGGDEDWLPCCFDGSHPPVEDMKNPGVLLPQKIFNQSNCSEDDACVSCGYSKGEIGLLYKAAEEPIIQVQRISVGKVVKSVDDRRVRFGRDNPEDLNSNMQNNSVVEYEITVNYNDAVSPLTEITVFDKLPPGLEYVWDSSKVDLKDSPKQSEPVVRGTTLTYNLTNLIPEGIKSKDRIYINFEARVVNNKIADIFANEAYATGIVRNETIRIGVGIESNRATASLPKN